MSQTQRESTAVESLDEMARAVAAVSGDLLASYERLEQRAGRMEEELERRVGELEAVLASLPTGVAVRDAEGAIVRSNRAFDDLTASATTPLSDTDGECSFIDESGAERHIYRKSSEVCSANGTGIGSVEIVDDRTELHDLSERVHHMNKMAALGTMATGIAHEIRNPLNAVQGYSELIRHRLSDDEELAEWTASIIAGVREVDGIISSLLTIARPEPLYLEAFELEDVCREAAARAFEGDSSSWSVEIIASDESITGDRIKLRQALRNLIANAVNAQPEGGSVRVTATADTERATFKVEDAGAGFNHSTVARCREPFFTTRAEGCGLGLPLVETIVRLHGGQLEIDPAGSELGGASISFWVPTNPCN